MKVALIAAAESMLQSFLPSAIVNWMGGVVA
jgi:hypothetical protein